MKSWWRRLSVYAWPEKSKLTTLILLMFVGIALSTLGPWPIKLIIDYVLTRRPMPSALAWLNALPGATSSTGLLVWMVCATVLLFLAGRALAVFQDHVRAGVSTRMVYSVGADLFEHLQRLSLRVHSQQRTGDLVQRVTRDSSCAKDLVMGVFMPVLTSTVSLLTVFVVMWQLDPSLSLLALLAAAPMPIFMKLLTGQITERTYETGQLQGKLLAHVEQTLTALPAVQAFGREEYEDTTFRSLSTHILRANMRSLFSQLKYKVAIGTPTAIGYAAMMVFGGLHVVQGSLSVGSLLVFIAYVGSLYGPISSLAYLSSSFASAAASARRVFEIFELDPGVRDLPGAVALSTSAERGRGHVRFEDVSFGYGAKQLVLNDINLEARPGEIVALVGPTGAGKSTLVSLIPRFFDPWAGRVMIDDIDVRNVTIASLRAQIALVLQEPFLLPLTIAENIAYGRPEASSDEIVAAAIAANADEFIRQLPNGYDTVIAERGATLSGGEKQRISIARALLKNAPILILDEPTSALDAGTEAMLLEALDHLMVGRTTFIIAHRLSTIVNADRIAVMERGQIVEIGNHQELLALKKHYRRYYNLQNRPASSEMLTTFSERGEREEQRS